MCNILDKIDILNREEFVKQLITITENISKNRISTSFAINGVWGSGKSFVLDMFEEKLSQIQSEDTATDKYFIVRYNCWECDYYEEPLVAIVATMLDTIEKKTKILYGENGEKIKGVLKAVGATLLSVANGTIKNTTGVDLSEAYKIVNSGITTGKAEYEKANEYDKYFSFKKALKSLHEVLNELSEQYTVVFLIDELDRCLPEYAIKVLERLHHLIEGTQNVIHIASIDKGQLQRSIQHIFGFDNPEEYLKKFIQFTVSLNLGVVSEKITDKFRDYVDLFDKNSIQFDDSIEEFMQKVFQKIDVREQERLIHRVTVAHNILFSERKDLSFMCLELLIVITTTCYKGTIYICENLKKFNSLVESGRNNVPFLSFFDEKFKALPYTEKRFVGTPNNKQQYAIKASNSLYAAIFTMWYELFLNNKSHKDEITVDDAELYAKLSKNIGELKEFSNIIRLIK